jgi:hypothetical protein
MSDQSNIFSPPEWAGIILMILGIIMGLQGCIQSTATIAEATEIFSEYMQGAAELSEIKMAIGKVNYAVSQGISSIRLAGIGFWVFISGIALFTIFRRRRWNTNE